MPVAWPPGAARVAEDPEHRPVPQQDRPEDLPRRPSDATTVARNPTQPPQLPQAARQRPHGHPGRPRRTLLLCGAKSCDQCEPLSTQMQGVQPGESQSPMPGSARIARRAAASFGSRWYQTALAGYAAAARQWPESGELAPDAPIRRRRGRSPSRRDRIPPPLSSERSVPETGRPQSRTARASRRRTSRSPPDAWKTRR